MLTDKFYRAQRAVFVMSNSPVHCVLCQLLLSTFQQVLAMSEQTKHSLLHHKIKRFNENNSLTKSASNGNIILPL